MIEQAKFTYYHLGEALENQQQQQKNARISRKKTNRSLKSQQLKMRK